MSTLFANESTPLDLQGQGLKIGVFDSGVGGLSVLRAIRAAMPLADLIYVADSGHAPYGERSDAFIIERSHEISRFLESQQVNGIVVACNTATAVAVQGLRESLPDLPIVGVEPGIKPAITQSHNKRVGVLATPGTLASQKFKTLVARHAQDAILTLQPCPGLAKEIESGCLDTPRLRELVAQFATPLRQAEVDTIVLGCTHYPFVAPLFAQALGPEVQIIDTADAVARQAARVCANPMTGLGDARTSSTPAQLQFWTSGDPVHLTTVTGNWLNLHIQAHPLP